MKFSSHYTTKRLQRLNRSDSAGWILPALQIVGYLFLLVLLFAALAGLVVGYNWGLAWLINWLLASVNESFRVTWVQVLVFNFVFAALFRTRFTRTSTTDKKA
jgi:hypothetical protein